MKKRNGVDVLIHHEKIRVLEDAALNILILSSQNPPCVCDKMPEGNTCWACKFKSIALRLNDVGYELKPITKPTGA